MSDQQEASVEQRLTSFFDKSPQKNEPEVAPQEQSEEPESEVSQPAADEPDQEQVSDDGEEEQAEPVAELEHLGKKYSVPESLKKAFEASRAQGTHATMEFATRSRALEVEKIALQATTAFQKESKELNQQLAQLNSYKEQARKIDWTQLSTDQKIDLDRELRNIDQQINELNGTVSGKEQQHRQQFYQFVTQAVAQTEQFMRQKVPGWNEETGRQLTNYGQQLGIPQEKLTTGWFADPSATHVLWKAQQWDQLQASRPGIANRANTAPPVTKPGSNAVQKSVAQSKQQQARANLKKTGSLDAFAEALLASQRNR